jgi:uncharacterized membrane protein
MLSLPNPLHPALVHFPIVLILLGALVAVVAVVVRRGHLPWLAAGLLVLGAAGALVAAKTGGDAAELVGDLNATGEQVLDEHEEWGEFARNLALVAAALAIGAASVSKFPRTARVVASLAAVAALTASYGVAQAGHYGGRLVYKHGAGINTAAGEAEDAAALRSGGGDRD